MYDMSSKLLGAENAAEAGESTVQDFAIDPENRKKLLQENLHRNLRDNITILNANPSDSSEDAVAKLIQSSIIANVVEGTITDILAGLEADQKEDLIAELNQELGIKAVGGQSNQDALKAFFSKKGYNGIEKYLDGDTTESASSNEAAKSETSEPENSTEQTPAQEVSTEATEGTTTSEPETSTEQSPQATETTETTQTTTEPPTAETSAEAAKTQPDLTLLKEENQRLQEQIKQLESSQFSQQEQIKALQAQLVKLTKAQKQAKAQKSTESTTQAPKTARSTESPTQSPRTASSAESTRQTPRRVKQSPQATKSADVFRYKDIFSQNSPATYREAQLSDRINSRLRGRNLSSTPEARSQAAFDAFSEIMALNEQDAIRSAQENIGQQGYLSKKVQATKNRLSRLPGWAKYGLLGAGTAAAYMSSPFAAAGVLTYAVVSKVADKVDASTPNRDFIAQQGILAQQMETRSIDANAHSQAKAEYLSQSKANKNKLYREFQQRVMSNYKFRNRYSTESELRGVLLQESLWLQRELKASQENANATMRRKTLKNLAIAGAITTIGFPMVLAAAPGLAAGTLTLGVAALNATGVVATTALSATGVAATTVATGAMAAGATVGAVASSGVLGAAAVGATAVGAGYAASKVMDSGSPQYT